MMNLFELHYQIQKGIYFSSKVATHAYNVYYSDKSTNMYWNYALLSDLVSPREVMDNIKKEFEKFERPVCVYINSNQQKDLFYLQEQKFKVNYTESWLRYDENIFEAPFSAKRVTSPEDRDNFIKIFSEIYGSPNAYGLILTPEIIQSLTASFDNEKYAHFISYNGKIPTAVGTLGCYNKYCMIFNLAARTEYADTLHRNAIIKSCVDYYHELDGLSLSLKMATNSTLEKWYIDNGFKKIYSGCRMSL